MTKHYFTAIINNSIHNLIKSLTEKSIALKIEVVHKTNNEYQVIITAKIIKHLNI